MKTVAQLKNQIELQVIAAKQDAPVKTQANKEAYVKIKRAWSRETKAAKKNAAFLRTCLRYLETDPREEFVQKEIEKLEIRINKVLLDFTLVDYQLPGKEFLKLKKKYEKENRIPTFRDQLKVLRFLVHN